MYYALKSSGIFHEWVYSINECISVGMRAHYVRASFVVFVVGEPLQLQCGPGSIRRINIRQNIFHRQYCSGWQASSCTTLWPVISDEGTVWEPVQASSNSHQRHYSYFKSGTKELRSYGMLKRGYCHKNITALCKVDYSNIIRESDLISLLMYSIQYYIQGTHAR
jgi:hypothetical protein